MKLSDLPNIEFVSSDAEEVKGWVLAKYKEVVGRTPAQGDPSRLFCLFVAEVFIRLLNDINYTGKQNLLKYALGDNLDHVGALTSVDRIQAKAATTTLKATLSAKRERETVIDAGTRVASDTGLYFAIDADLIIPAGELTGIAKATCTEPGAEGNNFFPGEIATVVDPVAYVESIVNTTTSGGGSEVEDDDAFRDRIHEAPESFSVAGPEGAYRFFAKSVNASIIDVGINSPEPGVVEIYPLLEGGELPGEEILTQVNDYLSNEKRRPLTDKLAVKAPKAINYAIDVSYYIDKEADASTVQANVAKAVTAYELWQKSVIGRDINPSKLITLVMGIAGVKRVVVTAPEFTVVDTDTSVAVASFKSVKMAGSEDE